jgi:hypothetical protein
MVTARRFGRYRSVAARRTLPALSAPSGVLVIADHAPA